MTDFKFELGQVVAFDGNVKCLVVARTLTENITKSSKTGDSGYWVDIRYRLSPEDGVDFSTHESTISPWTRVEAGDTLQEDTRLETLTALPIGTVLFAETEQAYFIKCSSSYFVKMYKNTALADSKPSNVAMFRSEEVLKSYIQSEVVVVQFIPED